MATTSDIREWALQNSHPDLSDTEPVPAGVRAEYRAREIPQTPETPDAAGEVKPKVRPSLSDRAKESFNRQKAAPTRRARAAKPAKPRSKAEGFLAWGWRMLGSAVGTQSEPVGAVMEMQAPVAGMILDDVLAGTVIDRIIQPFVGQSEKGKAISALLGPPVIVAALQAQPGMYKVAIPALEQCMALWMDVAGPKFKELEERAKKFEEEYGETIRSKTDAILFTLGWDQDMVDAYRESRKPAES